MKTACSRLVEFSDDEALVAMAKERVEVAIPKREKEIRGSARYRTELALETCREFQAWVRAQKRAGNLTALQAGLEGSRGEAFEEAVQYLGDRVYSMSSMDAQYRLGRRVREDCGG